MVVVVVVGVEEQAKETAAIAARNRMMRKNSTSSSVPQGDHPLPSPLATREQVASSSGPLVLPARFEPPSPHPSPAGHT